MRHLVFAAAALLLASCAHSDAAPEAVVAGTPAVQAAEVARHLPHALPVDAMAVTQALASHVPASRGGHEKLSCSTTGDTSLAPANFKATDASGNRAATPTEFFVFNPSTSVIVYIYSGNGQAATDGIPLCDASGCVRGLSLTRPELWNCQAVGSAQDVHLLGVHYGR